MIAVIDSGIANLRSVTKALERLGEPVAIVNSADRLDGARGIILPGVGAFADGIAKLRTEGFVEPLRRAIDRGTPVLGICLGLHFLFSESEEFGRHKGMDLIPGQVVRFPEMRDAAGNRLKVPHMGWNQVRIERAAPIFRGLPEDPFFYFVHSYYVRPLGDELTAGTTEYGIRFASTIWRDNLFATQFHPEKSQGMGLQLLRNFAALCR